MASSDQMRALFDSMDHANKGFIVKDDILSTISHAGLDFTDDEVIKMLENMDPNMVSIDG